MEGLKSDEDVRPGERVIDWVPLIQFGGIHYLARWRLAGHATREGDRDLTVEDLGREFYRIAFRGDGYVGGHYRYQDGDSTYLDPGTPVYSVKGYAPEFRLATLEEGRVRLFESDTNPLARTGEDLLDIRGKVKAVDILSEEDARTVLGTIDEESQVERFVETVLLSPVNQQRRDHEGQRYFLGFRLADGTSAVRAFWLESGELSRGIMTDPIVTLSVWSALGKDDRPVATEDGPRISIGCRMEAMLLVHRGSRIMSPLIPSVLLAVLVLAACSTAAPLATPTAPSEVGWGDGTGTVLPSGTLQLFPSAQPSPDWTLVEAPGWAYVPGFSLRLPPGWELNELQGIDSYVGEVVGDNVRLEFDYGAYSWTLDPAEDPENEYAVIYEGIGDVEGKLLIPTGDSGGYTGIYFKNLGGQSFNLVGEDLTPEQQQTAFAIFRSIRSLGQSGSTTDPDEVTLEGPGVIRHDWDHSPLINGVRKIIQGTHVDGVCVYTYRMFRGPNDPPKIQRTLASNPDTCEELVEEGTLAYPAGNEPEDAAMESVTAIPRDQAKSLGVELVAIDSHWDNNGIALWWEGIDIEVSHWIVERSTDADGPWDVVTIRTPSELLPEDDPLKYARVWDSKLPPGHHYYYRLSACTNEGSTGYSNVVEATVPDFMPGLAGC